MIFHNPIRPSAAEFNHAYALVGLPNTVCDGELVYPTHLNIIYETLGVDTYAVVRELFEPHAIRLNELLAPLELEHDQ